MSSDRAEKILWAMATNLHRAMAHATSCKKCAEYIALDTTGPCDTFTSVWSAYVSIGTDILMQYNGDSREFVFSLNPFVSAKKECGRFSFEDFVKMWKPLYHIQCTLDKQMEEFTGHCLGVLQKSIDDKKLM